MPEDSAEQVGSALYSHTEDFYFWLMRSIHEPKNSAHTFQALSQIMRVALMANKGGSYLTQEKEKEAIQHLSTIKEQLADGKIHFQTLSKQILPILQKLTHENPKAQLIAHATEIEYIFCINAPSHSCPTNDYQTKFQGYLKTIVETVNHSLSEIQAKAIVQVMSQILKNPENFPTDPHETLREKLEKIGIHSLKMTG